MAGTPSVVLSDDEKAFLNTPPPDAPLDDPADEEPGELEGDAGNEPEPKKADDAKGKTDTKDKDGKEPPKDAKKPEKTPEENYKGMAASERQRRKAVEDQYRRERQEWAEKQARLDERLSLINEALSPKPEPAPAPEDDIFGAHKTLAQRVEAFEKAEAERKQREQQAQAQQQYVQRLVNAYAADAEAFREENPDFQEAYDYLIASRKRELGLLPQFRGNKVALNEALGNDEIAIAQVAINSGERPSELLYRLAQERGWKPKEPEPEPANTKTEAAEPKPSGEDEIKRLAKAQDAATSLSTAGGAPGGDKITLETVDRMSKDEFTAFVAKLNKKDRHGYDKWTEKQMVGRT